MTHEIDKTNIPQFLQTNNENLNKKLTRPPLPNIKEYEDDIGNHKTFFYNKFF